MRTVIFVNNLLGVKACQFLVENQATNVVGAVVHPEPKAKHREQILDTLQLPGERVLEAPLLADADGQTRLSSWQPEIGLSVLFGFILKRSVLDIFPHGVVNLHPALLPWNRGAYPNVWPILDGTPAGVTLHLMDEGVDTGPIFAQRRVPVEATDTGHSLYKKLEREAESLLKDCWEQILFNEIKPDPQERSEGTTHRKRDVNSLDELNVEETMKVGDLLDRLRARTYPPYSGCYFEDETGRRVYLRLELYREPDEED